MNRGRTIFSQVLDYLPRKAFATCVKRYNGERYMKSFSCMDQFLCMAFAQLSYRESLRDIECCLRAMQSGVKAHTLLDLHGDIPCWVHVTPAKIHDVNALDLLPIEPGSFYVMDRGYLDFKRLFAMNGQLGFFITRTKRTTRYRRLYSRPVDKSNGLRCDQTVVLVNFYAKRDYPDKLRVVKFVDPETGRRFTFLTNNFDIAAQTVADLYRLRWRVELFFKWIKQHLRIKAFFGTSENAVKTQIRIVISVYVLVAILKKRLSLDELSLYTILQILSVTLFEKTPILQALSQIESGNIEDMLANQLNLFDY